MRVVLSILFDRKRSAAVGVALTKHGIDGAAFNSVVSRFDRFLFFGLWTVRVIRQDEAIGLKLFNAGDQLGHRSRDVR